MVSRIVIIIKGFCMGIADVIPGVSGGTMALILGIYERLIDAIRSVDLRLVRELFTGSFWKTFFRSLVAPTKDEDQPTAPRAVKMAFLAVLVVGIAAAALTGVRFIPRLLTEYRAPTLGFFFGLVLASVAVPYRLMARKSWREAIAFLLAVVGTFFLVGLKVDDTANARGVVTLTAGAEITEAVRLPTADTRISTFRFEGNAKREIIFLPDFDQGEIVVPAGGQPLELSVVAQMPGEESNLPAGELSLLLQPKAQGVTVSQAAATAGGSNPALWWIFLCGALAICAMILPGISGSFILLLLGQYFYVVYTVHEIVYGKDMSRLPVLLVFLAGIVVGILAFSRLLNWLLARYHSLVMAVLVGLMLGSLRKIWPFQTITPEGSANVLPSAIDQTVLLTGGTFLAGLAVVLVINYLGSRKERAAA